LLAAFAVFVSHGYAQMISGGVLWQLDPYGPEAVTVFFVLSGFVIAHVTVARESTFREYAVARAARIYSVVLPALILTAVADYLGRSVNTSFYSAYLHYDTSGQVWRFLASGFFLNELWTLHFTPGSNVPYWSLGYEVWYYIIFSAAIFLRGRARILMLSALLLTVGPGICVMLPLWLLGVGAFWLCSKDALAPRSGAVLFVSSIGAWAAYEAVAWHSGRWLITNPQYLSVFKRSELPQDFLVAIAFAGSLVGFNALSKPLEPYTRGSWAALRWLAGGTFSLYLFHDPLLRFFAAINPYAPRSWAGHTLVLGGTLTCVFLVAEFTERKKGAWRRLFDLLAHAIKWLRSRAVEALCGAFEGFS
jgi:peptidoglycan/LPS O-acetylase OafA/YrhL